MGNVLNRTVGRFCTNNEFKGGDCMMKDYRKVLIAVNSSRDVLVQGLRLVNSGKCQITVVRVIPPYEGDLSLVGVKNIKDVLDGGTEGFISEVKEVAEAEGALVKVRIEEGEIHGKILEVAEAEKSDLIIMGTCMQHGIKKLLLGNMVDKVTSHAPCPVLVVNDKKESSLSCFYNMPDYCGTGA
ncbi:MAG: universal stress protein [Nitrospirota bacterium]